MKQTFTLNQCLRMLYGETTPEESFMLNEIIDHNATLNREVKQMREMIQELNSMVYAPSSSSVDNILRIGRDKALEFSL